MSSKLRWPTWSAVLKRWQSCSVPEVQVRAYEFESRSMAPWRHRNDKLVAGFSNPLADTAGVLCWLANATNPELTALFKLTAFCRQLGLSAFSGEILLPVRRRLLSSDESWWHSNARHVVPYSSFVDWYPSPGADQEQCRQWREIVDRAALLWKDIAQQWVVVRIPDFMDPDSDEYREYTRRADARYERRERDEFERLKAKFEGPGGEPQS
jgi:hypothetical protein